MASSKRAKRGAPEAEAEAEAEAAGDRGVVTPLGAAGVAAAAAAVVAGGGGGGGGRGGVGRLCLLGAPMKNCTVCLSSRSAIALGSETWWLGPSLG